MTLKSTPNFANSINADLTAGLVVFLVALPLCLGIPLASGTPIISGLVAGVIGGILVSSISKSALGVTGPAAGLSIVVLESVKSLNNIEVFFCAVVVSGIFQVLFALFKLDLITQFIPTAVIRGMLAGIGAVIIIKQLPNLLGGGSNLQESLANFTPAILAVSLFSLFLHTLWDNKNFLKNSKIKKGIPSALIVILGGTTLIYLLQLNLKLASGIGRKHFVDVPFLSLDSSFFKNIYFADLSAILKTSVILVGLKIAIIGSIETLLSTEAIDRLDPFRRTTPTNREMWAQGIGNIVSGLLGGLPMTAVVARSSANVYAGGRTQTSAIFNGILIGLSVLFIPTLLNQIPIASLAIVLIFVGYKLTSPKIMKEARSKGKTQFLLFIVTYISVVFLGLLDGVIIGVALALVIVILANIYNKAKLESGTESEYRIELKRDLTFLNKADLKKKLNKVPSNSKLVIDGSNCQSMDEDIIELLNDFELRAQDKSISLTKLNLENKRFSLSRINR
jgi:MFS superfamily sulfate permease-like transporter